jgi:hypothetical protein
MLLLQLLRTTTRLHSKTLSFILLLLQTRSCTAALLYHISDLLHCATAACTCLCRSCVCAAQEHICLAAHSVSVFSPSQSRPLCTLKQPTDRTSTECDLQCYSYYHYYCCCCSCCIVQCVVGLYKRAYVTAAARCTAASGCYTLP